MLTIGTAGHIDHGKTTLTRLLTGKDTDRLPEEVARGMSIELGFARLESAPGQWVGLVDVPGHERFVHTMVAGAWGIQGFLLVLAADEGVMPQTREHLQVLRLLGVTQGVVALSKTDLAEEDMVALVEDEITELLAGEGFPEAEVVAYASTRPESVEAVRQALERLRARLQAPPERGLFRLPVDRVFTLKGRGTVVTGTVASGRVEVGQEVVFLPSGKASRVRSIHTFEEDRPFARAGERAALNVPDLATGDIERGAVAVKPGSLEAFSVLDARVEVLRGLPDAFHELASGVRVRVHLGTATVSGRLHLLGASALAGGADGLAQLRLEEPLVALAGDRFLLRAVSPPLTLGGGMVLETGSPRYKRGAAVVTRLERIEVEGTPGLVRARLEASPRLVETVAELAAGLHVPEKEVRAALKERALADLARREGSGGPFYGDASRLARAEEILFEAVAAHHREHPEEVGVPRDALAAAGGLNLPTPVVGVLVASLGAAGRVVEEEGRVRLPGHESRVEADLEAVRGVILAFLEAQEVPFQGVQNLSDAAGLAPAKGEKVLEALVKTGDLLRLPGPIYAPAVHLKGLRAKVLELLDARRPQAVSTAEVKAALDLPRKALIPLLESMDEAAMTLRAGEGRIRRPGYKGSGE